MKVLVVDDSIVFRSGITQALSKEPGLSVFKAVSNGKIAVDFLKSNADIDIITLDMEMPVMGGLEAIKEIRKFNRKVVIIVFSALTVRGAETTIDALTHGANDFVSKIEGTGNVEESIEMIRNELMPKIRAFASKKGEDIRSSGITKETIEKTSVSTKEPKSKLLSALQAAAKVKVKPELLCIASSTGGPDALRVVFQGVKEKPTFPLLIVQHMPPIFTQKLAQFLNDIGPVDFKEAEEGDILEPGLCLIAPGNYHMEIEKKGTKYQIKLNQNEKVCFVRPSADVLFSSVAKQFNGSVASIVLTGMGSDGTNGSKDLVKEKNCLFIQDKESSAVWGMAGSVDKEELGSVMVKLDEMGMLIDGLNGVKG